MTSSPKIRLLPCGSRSIEGRDRPNRPPSPCRLRPNPTYPAIPDYPTDWPCPLDPSSSRPAPTNRPTPQHAHPSDKPYLALIAPPLIRLPSPRGASPVHFSPARLACPESSRALPRPTIHPVPLHISPDLPTSPSDSSRSRPTRLANPRPARTHPTVHSSSSPSVPAPPDYPAQFSAARPNRLPFPSRPVPTSPPGPSRPSPFRPPLPPHPRPSTTLPGPDCPDHPMPFHADYPLPRSPLLAPSDYPAHGPAEPLPTTRPFRRSTPHPTPPKPYRLADPNPARPYPTTRVPPRRPSPS